MPRNGLVRRSIDANLPEGAAWKVAPGGDLDKLLDGIGACRDSDVVALSKLSVVRDPFKAEDIEQLEKEYGFSPDPTLSDTQRRARVAALAFAPRSTGAGDYLEARLREAGFDVHVYDNDPPVNPDMLIGARFHAMCGFETSVCGYEGAQCGGWNGGEYIVNGDLYRREVNFTTACGLEESVCGYYEAMCGSFVEARNLVLPDAPPEPTWPLVFFIGGDVTRDIDGTILDIERVVIPDNLRALFRTIVLRFKPLYTWAAVAVEWSPTGEWEGYGFFPYGNSAYGL
jgi:hypothetical protein